VTAVACLGILVTPLAHYANRVLVNSDSFSQRAVTVVHTGPVESLIVDTVTNRLMAYVGDQTSLRPTIEQGVREALSNQQITDAIRAAAGSLQRQLVSGNATALTLTLPDVGASIASRIEPISPQLADEVTRIGTITVLDVPIPPAAATAVNDLATVGRDFTLLLVVTVAMIALALAISADRGRTLIVLGLAAFASGALAVAAYLGGRGIVVNEFSSGDARTAAQTAWSVYLGGLETTGFVLAGIGAVAALAGAVV
jgi:hypothetical protein